jgi:tetratricopeptide (TPR) repeat protein
MMRHGSWIASGVVVVSMGVALWMFARPREPVAGGSAPPSRVLAPGISLPANPTAGPSWDSAVSLARSGAFEAAARKFALGAAHEPRDAAWPQAEAECWAAAGRHDSVLAALERCQAIAPLSGGALSRRRASRLELGFAMASSGEPWKGRQLGEAILQEAPEDSEATLLVGYSQAMSGNPASAELVLQRLIEEHPGVHQAYQILVQCAFRRGDAEAAERWIQQIAANSPASPELSAFRQQLQVLRSQNVGASNGHLKILCVQACPYGLDADVMESAENAWRYLKGQLDVEPYQTVNILLGGNAKAPHWAAATFDGQVHLPLDPAVDPGRREVILRHELTHAFLADAGGGQVPLWLNEGLAQYFQGARCDKLPDATSADWLDSLATRKTFLDLDQDRAELAYTYSLAVAQELMELNTSTILGKYLKSLREGVPEPLAFQNAFGGDYPRLSARIRARL